MNWKILITDPAPFMVTHLTYHMRASSFFFNTNTTILANTNMYVRVRPILIFLIYLLFTGLSLMRGIKTLKAVGLIAFWTLNISILKLLMLFQETFTIGCWAAF
jgi:hypothetical protein